MIDAHLNCASKFSPDDEPFNPIFDMCDPISLEKGILVFMILVENPDSEIYQRRNLRGNVSVARWASGFMLYSDVGNLLGEGENVSK